MLNESNLHNYQRAAVQHIINHPFCGEWKRDVVECTNDEVKYLINEYV